MSLPDFVLTAVTSMNVTSINFKILIFSLKTKKKKLNEVEHYSHCNILRRFILKGAGPAEQRSKATYSMAFQCVL